MKAGRNLGLGHRRAGTHRADDSFLTSHHLAATARGPPLETYRNVAQTQNHRIYSVTVICAMLKYVRSPSRSQCFEQFPKLSQFGIPTTPYSASEYNMICVIAKYKSRRGCSSARRFVYSIRSLQNLHVTKHHVRIDLASPRILDFNACAPSLNSPQKPAGRTANITYRIDLRGLYKEKGAQLVKMAGNQEVRLEGESTIRSDQPGGEKVQSSDRMLTFIY